MLQVDSHIKMILNDMVDTLHATPNAAAIAACQIGILKRLVVIDMDNDLIKLVNPQIIEASGKQECVEGCLSFPGKFGKTIRPRKVKVKALDENGNEIILTGEGDMSKCFCHEIDHLNGIVE